MNSLRGIPALGAILDEENFFPWLEGLEDQEVDQEVLEDAVRCIGLSDAVLNSAVILHRTAVRELELRRAGVAQQVRLKEWVLMSGEAQKAEIRLRLQGLYACTERALAHVFLVDNRPFIGIAAERAIHRCFWEMRGTEDVPLPAEAYKNLDAQKCITEAKDPTEEESEPEFLLALQIEFALRASGKAVAINLIEFCNLPEHTQIELVAQRLEAMGQTREASFELAKRTIC